MSSQNKIEFRLGDVLIRQDAGVVWATLDRPKVVNALNDGLVEGLEQTLNLARKSDAILVVLRGAGGNFCAGADLKYVGTLYTDLEGGLFRYIDRLRAICDELAEGPFISLAVIEGYALAGGYEILTACDIAVSTANASIGDRHLEYALAPGLGASVRIASHLSAKRSRYLAYSGEIISGTEAAAWGLVSHAWDASTFEEKVAGLISRLASRSKEAVRSYKQMLLRAEREPFDVAIGLEKTAFREYQSKHADARKGVERFATKSGRNDKK